MELSPKERDRLVAEERVRFTARAEMMRESGHCQTGGCCRKKCGFWAGLLVGLAIWAVSAAVCHERYGGFMGHCMMNPAGAASTPTK